jgi:hypothetical protein
MTTPLTENAEKLSIGSCLRHVAVTVVVEIIEQWRIIYAPGECLRDAAT